MEYPKGRKFKEGPVYDALLNHRNKGKQGCKGADSGCSKLHPKFCHYSLNKGVCFDKDCSLGLHVKGTNTKAARTKAEENKENKRSPAKAEYPHLPQPQQPAGLHQALGNRAQAGTQQQQQLASEETVSFLGNCWSRDWSSVSSLKSMRRGRGRRRSRQGLFSDTWRLRCLGSQWSLPRAGSQQEQRLGRDPII